MMSVNRRFFALEDENSVFRFKIDTRFVNAGATDGSQLDNQFILPFLNNTSSGFVKNFIMKVNDGRPDIIVNTVNFITTRIVSFTSPGVYEITCIGMALNLSFKSSITPDKAKLIYVDRLDPIFTIQDQAFLACINCVFDVSFMVVNNLSLTFNGIKNFGPNANIENYDVSKATTAYLTLSGTPPKVFQGFFPALTNASQYLKSLNLSLIPTITIIATNLTNVSEMLSGSNFRGKLEIRSESLVNIEYLNRYTTNPPSMGLVDIRRVTTATDFITSIMSTTNVDATLLGWQNNFDWSVIPSVTATYDFYNSKYSNNPAVIAAKAFLESKGITFTRLTMA